MNKHCTGHSHYTPDCNECKRAYAVWKQESTKPASTNIAANIAKPGAPFSITEEATEFIPAMEFNEITDGTELPDLSNMSVPELRKLCSKKGITRIDGMPVSNCKREQLISALLGGSGAGSNGSGNGEGGKPETGELPEMGPQPGKPQAGEIPPPMQPFADSILKSKQFEDAVRHADVMGEVKHVLASHKDAIHTTASNTESVRKALHALASKMDKGIEVSGGKITVEMKPGAPPITINTEGMPNSPILKRVVEHLANREHVALVGPAGSGKSTIVRLACKALGAKLFHTPCGGDIREQHLLGRTIPVEGEWTYIPAPFVTGFESEEPSVILLDEMDGVSDPSTLLTINDVLAGFDKLALPWRWSNPYAQQGKGFLGVAATMNTIGAGATALYQGRTALDGSTLDRFVGRIIVVGYDNNYEEAYVKGPEGTPVTPNGKELLDFIRQLRKYVEANNLRRIVSTRMLQQGVAMLRRGWSFHDVKEALLTGWSPDDRRLCKV